MVFLAHKVSMAADRLFVLYFDSVFLPCDDASSLSSSMMSFFSSFLLPYDDSSSLSSSRIRSSTTPPHTLFINFAILDTVLLNCVLGYRSISVLRTSYAFIS